MSPLKEPQISTLITRDDQAPRRQDYMIQLSMEKVAPALP